MYSRDMYLPLLYNHIQNDNSCILSYPKYQKQDNDSISVLAILVLPAYMVHCVMKMDLLNLNRPILHDKLLSP